MSRKVAGSGPDEVDVFNLPNPSSHIIPGVDSASNRNEYQESSWGGKGRLACKTDNHTAICEPTV
jgi:actin-related protein